MKKITSLLVSALLAVSTIATCGVKANAANIPGNANLLNTYGNVIPKVGTAFSADEMFNPNTLKYATREFNSMTAVNEMKPDAVLRAWAPRQISVAEAKSRGYYIPDNYPENIVPELDFGTVDRILETCYNNGLALRGHTLVWHGQTPDWFFRDGYNKYAGYVSPNVMNKRMEFFIKTYMGHVCQSKYSSVVYAWDVVNEFLHAGDASGWQKIYGRPNTRAQFIKDAFNYAYDTLAYFKMTDKVKLFYNDYNTYMEVNDVINLINFINSGRKVCAGIGMQSHLGLDFPSPDYYKAAIDAFRKAGFEIQITELDAGKKGASDQTQAKYYYDVMKAILDEKKMGANITALVWWGQSDDHSWRDDKPLLYSNRDTKKPAYNAVLQAYFDSGYTMNGSQNNKPVNPPSETANLADGWYYIKNVNAQKYLQVQGNNAKANTNVELRTGNGSEGQKWYLKNVGNGYITLKSALGEFMLDVANGENKDDANIGIYNAYSGDAQQFMLKKSANGSYVVATKCSNLTKVLDDANNNKADGANVCQWTYNGQTNQQWIFEPAETKAGQDVRLEDGWYNIKNVNAQKYLQVEGNVGANCQNVELRSGNNSDGQKWYLKNLNDGYVLLTSKLGDFALDVYCGEDKDGTNIEIYRNTAKDPQRFKIQTSTNPGAYIIATKSSNLTKVLDDTNYGKEDGTNVCQWTYGGKENQQWIFEKIG